MPIELWHLNKAPTVFNQIAKNTTEVNVHQLPSKYETKLIDTTEVYRINKNLWR